MNGSPRRTLREVEEEVLAETRNDFGRLVATLLLLTTAPTLAATWGLHATPALLTALLILLHVVNAHLFLAARRSPRVRSIAVIAASLLTAVSSALGYQLLVGLFQSRGLVGWLASTASAALIVLILSATVAWVITRPPAKTSGLVADWKLPPIYSDLTHPDIDDPVARTWLRIGERRASQKEAVSA